MTSKWSNMVVELLYATFVIFFYYYMFVSIVQLRPFTLGFHPQTDLEQLSCIVLLIFVSVLTWRGVSWLGRFLYPNFHARKVYYIPSERHSSS